MVVRKGVLHSRAPKDNNGLSNNQHRLDNDTRFLCSAQYCPFHPDRQKSLDRHIALAQQERASSQPRILCAGCDYLFCTENHFDYHRGHIVSGKPAVQSIQNIAHWVVNIELPADTCQLPQTFSTYCQQITPQQLAAAQPPDQHQPNSQPLQQHLPIPQPAHLPPQPSQQQLPNFQPAHPARQLMQQHLPSFPPAHLPFHLSQQQLTDLRPANLAPQPPQGLFGPDDAAYGFGAQFDPLTQLGHGAASTSFAPVVPGQHGVPPAANFSFFPDEPTQQRTVPTHASPHITGRPLPPSVGLLQIFNIPTPTPISASDNGNNPSLSSNETVVQMMGDSGYASQPPSSTTHLNRARRGYWEFVTTIGQWGDQSDEHLAQLQLSDHDLMTPHSQIDAEDVAFGRNMTGQDHGIGIRWVEFNAAASRATGEPVPVFDDAVPQQPRQHGDDHVHGGGL